MSLEKFSKKNKIKLTIILAILFVIALFAFDVRLKTVTYIIESDKVDNPVRIALLTDLHGCDYGENQQTLVNAIAKENPDVILLGGDIFDDVVPYEKSEVFIAEIADNYPCYYVTGNHEYWSGEVDVILDIISSYGVKILDGTVDIMEINGEKLQISGISDPDGFYYLPDQPTYIQQLIEVDTQTSEEYFSVLLSHRPENIENYLVNSPDLALSGHAHGGQWRIPFILNGVFAPNQGLFPEYAGGLYEFEDMDFIVSRGLARESTLIPRIFNRPELVIVDII